MNCTDMNVMVEVLDKQGLPLIILAAIVYALWRIAKWVIPQIQTFTQTYLQLVEVRNKSHEENSRRCIEQQEAVARTLQAIQVTLVKLSEKP